MKWYEITFCVPCEEWQKVKNKILSINFKDNEPFLTKHKPYNNYEYATFTSAFYTDLWIVIDILPLTSKIIGKSNIIK
jgi:hypothetical protein